MPTLPALAAAMLALGLASAALAEDRPVTIATEGAYPPFNLTRPDGQLDGFEIDLAQALCAQANLACILVTQNFAGEIPGLQARKFDAIMDSIQITPEREKVVAFSIPYLSVPSTFAVAKDGPLATLPASTAIQDFGHDPAAATAAAQALAPLLKGRTIGVQTASVQAVFVETYLKDAVTVREYQTVAQEVLDLNDGRLDAVFGQLVVLQKQLGKPQFADLTLAGARFTGGVLGKGIGIALRQDDAPLKTAFDGAIGAMQADGTLAKLAVKWFGIDISTRP